MAASRAPNLVRRPQMVAQEVRSSLAVTTYVVRPQRAVLLVLTTGRVDLRVTTIHGPCALWQPANQSGVRLCLSPGSRGEFLDLAEAALAGSLPATALGDEQRRLLGEQLLLPLPADDDRRRLFGYVADIRRELDRCEPGVGVACSSSYHLYFLNCGVGFAPRLPLRRRGRCRVS